MKYYGVASIAFIKEVLKYQSIIKKMYEEEFQRLKTLYLPANANHLEKGKKYSPMVGTKIVKEYKGKMLEVTVVEEGFSFEGNIFKSLSAVAQKITGTKWNGPRFFNVNEAA